jgi:hypothetical protein
LNWEEEWLPFSAASLLDAAVSFSQQHISIGPCRGNSFIILVAAAAAAVDDDADVFVVAMVDWFLMQRCVVSEERERL